MNSDGDSCEEETEVDEICCVPGCDVQNDTDEALPVIFHKLPTRPKLLDKWMKLIGRKRSSLPSDAHVCSLHFATTCYSEDDRGRKVLKRSAVPTIKPKSQTTPPQGTTKTPMKSPVIPKRTVIKTEIIDTSLDGSSKTNTFPEGTQIVVLDKPSGEVEQSESSRKIVVLLPASAEGGEPSETEDLEKSDSDFDSETESSPYKARSKNRSLAVSESGDSNQSKLEKWRLSRDEEITRGPSGRKILKPGPNSRSRRKVLKPQPNRPKMIRTSSPDESPKRNILKTSSGNEAYQLKKRIVELEKDNVKLQKIISTEKAKSKQLRDKFAVLKQNPSKQGNSRVIIAHVRF